MIEQKIDVVNLNDVYKKYYEIDKNNFMQIENKIQSKLPNLNLYIKIFSETLGGNKVGKCIGKYKNYILLEYDSGIKEAFQNIDLANKEIEWRKVSV